jgi:predicted RNase H-like HicB family nuclease
LPAGIISWFLTTEERIAALHALQQVVIPPGGAWTLTYTSRCCDMKEHAMQFTAIFEKVAEGYIAFVEEIPGTNTQGDTLDEARNNLAESVQLVLEANRILAEESLAGKHITREFLDIQFA